MSKAYNIRMNPVLQEMMDALRSIPQQAHKRAVYELRP